MAWLIKFDGQTVKSDDFTIEEVGEIEDIGGTPWSIANPLRSVKVASAFIAVALHHLGKSEDETSEVIGGLTLGKIKRAFEFVSDDLVEEGADAPGEDSGEAGPPVPISRASSTGARSGAGSRRKSAASA